MVTNPFLLQPDQYHRDINFLDDYVQSTAFYLSTNTGDSIETCLKYVKSQLHDNGAFPLKDPSVRILRRDKVGDRKVEVIPFSSLMNEVVTKELLVSPSMAIYQTPKVKQSVLGLYIKTNMAKRKVHKKAMLEATARGDVSAEKYSDNLQNSTKIKNNSLSGAHSSKGTILFNKSSHSTLTSTCRAGSSYGNANNEKFLMGNRHYWSPNIVIANITHLVRHCNYDTLQIAISRYGIHLPSVDETMACIRHSTDLYWRNEQGLAQIQEYLLRLTPLQRAAFVYLGDAYHFCKYNESVMREFIDQLTLTPDVPHPDPKTIMNRLSGDMAAMVTMLRSDIINGRLIKDIVKEDPDVYAIIASTAVNVERVIRAYAPLIEGLWRPNSMPASVYSIQGMMRRCAVVSDTDSTIFTNQWWAEWYNGELAFTPKAYKSAYAMTYLTSQAVAHLLAKMSANMGVVTEQIHQLAMKNEYFFPVFATTSRAKHYYATISAREGVVFSQLKKEIKGVEMRSSNAPPEINQMLDATVISIMHRFMAEGQLSMDSVLGHIANIEHDIIRDINNGGFKYMRILQIKDPTSYVDGEDSTAYQHHKLWTDVFSPYYGVPGEPPYAVVKISVNLPNRKAIDLWLSKLPNQELATRMTNWLNENQKNKITCFLFPLELLELRGIPPEIIPVIAMRELVYGVMSPFYLVLESLGFFMINERLTRLLSDTYPYTTLEHVA